MRKNGTIWTNSSSASGRWHFILGLWAGERREQRGGRQKRKRELALSIHLSLSDSLISLPWLTRRERTITFFLFSFNYRCQGVVPTITLFHPRPLACHEPSHTLRISLCLVLFPGHPLLFLYLFQLSTRREFVITLDFFCPPRPPFLPCFTHSRSGSGSLSLLAKTKNLFPSVNYTGGNF